MSVACLILGNSGTGKSTSLRNFDPSKVGLIQCIAKPLPFRSAEWQKSVVQTTNTEKILRIIQDSKRDIIIIDDYQACLVNELMEKSSERGFDKFTVLAKNAWRIFQAAGEASPNKRVYILAHTQTDDSGFTRMKTVGKMVDQTIVPEGYFTIVLKTDIVNGEYIFNTQSSGSDCCKSPFGMFKDDRIPNDLKLVDDTITEFYGITTGADNDQNN